VGANAEKQNRLPRIFYVNWFRKSAGGRFLWPGYGDNARVLAWIFDRCAGIADAVTTPIGLLPHPDNLDTTGMELAPKVLEELLAVDVSSWRDEVVLIEEHYARFGDRLPPELRDQLLALDKRLAAEAVSL
jgi:phosphoenolpyruvate carboxykinase (GTP)